MIRRVLEEHIYNDCPQCGYRGNLVHVGKLIRYPIESVCRRDKMGVGICLHKWSFAMTRDKQGKWRVFFKTRGRARIAIRQMDKALARAIEERS